MTGFASGRVRNADTKDMKRPVIDIEFMQEEEDGVTFEKLPVAFPGKQIAKLSQGIHEGDIVTVFGELRSDKSGLYLEAESISITSLKEKQRNRTRAQMELLQMDQKFNLVSIIGKINPNNTVTVKRDQLSRGDLSTEDVIPLYCKKEIPHNSSEVICAGRLGVANQDDIVRLFVSNIVGVVL